MFYVLKYLDKSSLILLRSIIKSAVLLYFCEINRLKLFCVYLTIAVNLSCRNAWMNSARKMKLYR